MGILVDSNILSDLITRDSCWYEWSAEKIGFFGNREMLVINPLIMAEVSVAFDSYEEMNAAFPADSFTREDLPWEASFLAGRCFIDYRWRLGVRRSPMPDFYIGAHALIGGHSLLTRDANRYRTYFPRLRLISPG